MISDFGDPLGVIGVTKHQKFTRKIVYDMVVSTHVVIIAAETRFAWNVDKFCVYEVSIQHFVLSNIADTVNKHKMAMAGLYWFEGFEKGESIYYIAPRVSIEQTARSPAYQPNVISWQPLLKIIPFWPFWQNLGLLLRLIPEKPLELPLP